MQEVPVVTGWTGCLGKDPPGDSCRAKKLFIVTEVDP